MKKSYAALFSFCLFTCVIFLGKMTAQCAAISIDTLYLESNQNYIRGSVVNEGDWYIIYPYFKLALDPNGFVFSDSHSVPSYLDHANGTNNGVTDFGVEATLLVPYDSIPENTALSGTLTIEDPNDSTVTCTIPFDWTVKPGGQTVSSNLTKHSAADIAIFPNPISSGTLRVESAETKVDKAELVDLDGRAVYLDNDLSSKGEFNIDMDGFAPGLYFLRLYADGGSVTKKVVKL